MGNCIEKALYNANLFIADNIIHIYRDSRTNASDILDYIISSTAIYNNSGESGLVG